MWGLLCFNFQGQQPTFHPLFLHHLLMGYEFYHCICIFFLLSCWATFHLPLPACSPGFWSCPPVPSFLQPQTPLAVKLPTTPRQISPKCTSPALHSLISPAAKQKMCIWWWLKVYHYSVSEVKQGMLTVFLVYFNAVSVYSKVSLSSAALFLLEGCQYNAFS